MGKVARLVLRTVRCHRFTYFFFALSAFVLVIYCPYTLRRGDDGLSRLRCEEASLYQAVCHIDCVRRGSKMSENA